MSLARRTLLKSLPAGLLAPHLAPLVARAEAEAAGAKPMRFVFVLEANGMIPPHVIPRGFKRPEMTSPKPNYEFRISGSDEIIDVPLGGPDGQLPEALDPLARHVDRVTLLTGLSGRVTSPEHSAGHGTLGCYPMWAGPKDITIDAALGKAHPSIRQLVSLGWRENDTHVPPQSVPPMFTGVSALGPNQNVSVLQDPVLAHQVLFGKIVGGDTRAEVGSQSLVLDRISRNIHAIKPSLPAEEGGKLERLADAFSSIGRRQSRLEEIDPARIPPLRPELKSPLSETARLEAHLEHAATALVCGLTNVVTFYAGIGFPWWPALGVGSTHQLGHQPHDPAALADRAKVRRFNAGLIAKFVDTLESVPEGDGSMMDNTLIVFLSTGAEGHHCTAMEWPMVLVGNLGGRLKTGGRYLNVPKYGGKGHATVAQFYTALLHAAGAPVDHFGMKDRNLVEAGLDQRGPWEYILA